MYTRLQPARPAVPWAEFRFLLWLPAYLLCFALLESLPASPYWSTQTGADRLIPFCSWFLIPYLSWYLLLICAGAYLFRHNRGAFRRYMAYLSLTSFANVLLWALVPNGQDLRPAVPDGLFGPAVALLYQIDTNTNVFPSGHVVDAVGAALALRDALGRRHPAARAVTLLAVCICASTVFLKQHSVLDVLGALALSALAGTAVYRKRVL